MRGWGRTTRVLAGLVAGIVLSLPMSGAALADGDRWGFSVVLGGHMPNLSAIDDGLYLAPLVGDATVLIREGGQTTAGDSQIIDTNKTEIVPFRYDNQIGARRFGNIGAFEFSWHPNERHALIFGIGSWEKTSLHVTSGNLPLQQFFVTNIVDSERRGKISYTEYTLGWRYDFYDEGRIRAYSRLSFHELFDIDYREDYVFRFTETPIPDLLGVRRDLVLTAQTASLFTAQIGMGVEWMLRDWLSLGLEAGYLLSEQDVQLRDVKVFDDFADNDQIDRSGLPGRALANRRLGYLLPGTTAEDLRDPDQRASFYRQINLRFDGWRAGLRLTLYF